MPIFLRLRKLIAATGGAAAVEFAFVAAVLLVPLTIGVYDFGTALYYQMQVGNAARAGAQYINVNGYSAGDKTSQPCSKNNFTCAVQAATPLGTNVTVTVASPYCGCQNGSAFTAASFSPPCNGCPTGQTAVTLAQVNASYTYYPIFSYLGFGPANGFNMTAATTALLY